MSRESSFLSFSIDDFIHQFDVCLRTLSPPDSRYSSRENPASNLSEPCLTEEEKQHAAGLMRVNHSGEVCAQALYMGQEFAATDLFIQSQMAQCAKEESDHLAWCESRLKTLGATPSILNPFWYTHSFLLGFLAGKWSNGVSLGFVAETEHQVGEHLEKHLSQLPVNDEPSRAIIRQMQEDEAKHEQKAIEAGGVTLPWVVRKMMGGVSKLMTTFSYYH